MWANRAYCNFFVWVAHDPTHPWPSAFNSNSFSSKILFNSPDDDFPPNNITLFPSGDVTITLSQIAYGNSGPVDKCLCNE